MRYTITLFCSTANTGPQNGKSSRRLTRHALLGHLSVVDLLLQGVIADEAVDVAEFPLTVAVDPAHRLGVVAGVPGGVEHDYAVGADEVHPQAARPEGRRTSEVKT